MFSRVCGCELLNRRSSPVVVGSLSQSLFLDCIDHGFQLPLRSRTSISNCVLGLAISDSLRNCSQDACHRMHLCGFWQANHSGTNLLGVKCGSLSFSTTWFSSSTTGSMLRSDSSPNGGQFSAAQCGRVLGQMTAETAGREPASVADARASGAHV